MERFYEADGVFASKGFLSEGIITSGSRVLLIGVFIRIRYCKNIFDKHTFEAEIWDAGTDSSR